MEFQTSENDLIKVSLMKGVIILGKKVQLSPWFIVLFYVLECLGPITYILTLPPKLLEVHLIFHVSLLNRYHGEGDYRLSPRKSNGSIVKSRNLFGKPRKIWKTSTLIVCLFKYYFIPSLAYFPLVKYQEQVIGLFLSCVTIEFRCYREVKG